MSPILITGTGRPAVRRHSMTCRPIRHSPSCCTAASRTVCTLCDQANTAREAPRLSALVLAGWMILTTLAAHRFWTGHDPAVRKQQQVQFYKNMAMIGGLLFAELT
jgi:hypothetical protein